MRVEFIVTSLWKIESTWFRRDDPIRGGGQIGRDDEVMRRRSLHSWIRRPASKGYVRLLSGVDWRSTISHGGG
jgi:hypothetical protein